VCQLAWAVASLDKGAVPCSQPGRGGARARAGGRWGCWPSEVVVGMRPDPQLRAESAHRPQRTGTCTPPPLTGLRPGTSPSTPPLCCSNESDSSPATRGLSPPVGLVYPGLCRWSSNSAPWTPLLLWVELRPGSLGALRPFLALSPSAARCHRGTTPLSTAARNRARFWGWNWGRPVLPGTVLALFPSGGGVPSARHSAVPGTRGACQAGLWPLLEPVPSGAPEGHCPPLPAASEPAP